MYVVLFVRILLLYVIERLQIFCAKAQGGIFYE